MRLIVLLSSLAILAGAGWVHYGNLSSEGPAQAAASGGAEEDAAWQFARSSNDTAVLIDFLQAYPDSEHATVAYARLEELAEQNNTDIQVTQRIGGPSTTPITE